MADGFFMVLADNSNYTNVRHKTFDQALAEARRLASLNAGIRFFVLQSMGAAKRLEPVEFERHTHDEIPF